MPYNQSKTATRRPELDGLRVLAFGLLILYHVGMYYVADWGWHIKSPNQSEGLQAVMLWCNQWRMSLLFLVSGSATAFLLLKLSSRQFLRNRHWRLLLPLIFGMLVVVVPQVYIEARSIGLIDASFGYFAFWGEYLNQNSVLFEEHKTLGSYHLTWNHLWYLMYIFSYSILLWGILKLTKMCRLARPTKIALAQLPRPLLVVIIPIALLMLNGALLYQRFPQTHAFVDDFYNHGRYFLVFMLGFVWVRLPQCWHYIGTLRHFTLSGAIISYAAVYYAFTGGSFGEGIWVGLVNNFVWSANSWLWILAVCGWAQRFLCRSNIALRYLNGGVYCYYVLHQTLIIVFAYWLAPIHLTPGLEALLLVCLTLLGCAIGYESLRRLPYGKVLFGISERKVIVRQSKVGLSRA